MSTTSRLVFGGGKPLLGCERSASKCGKVGVVRWWRASRPVGAHPELVLATSMPSREDRNAFNLEQSMVFVVSAKPNEL